MTPPRTAPAVLIAPDKFQGSLSAAEVTTALTHGIHRAAPHTAVLSCPIADGGDGTVDAALAAGSTAHSITVTGPTGEARRSRYALAGDGTVHVVVAAATHPPLAGWFTRGTGIAVPLTVEGEARAR